MRARVIEQVYDYRDSSCVRVGVENSVGNLWKTRRCGVLGGMVQCPVCYSTFVAKGGEDTSEKPRQRGRQARWDRRNLRTISTHLTVQEAVQLQRICNTMGITPYHLLKKFLQKVIRSGA